MVIPMRNLKKGFRSDLKLKTGKNRLFSLIEGFSFKGKYQVIVVPQHFETDLASVPRFLWSILPSYGSYTKPAVVHDMLWRVSRGTFKAGHFQPFLDPVDVDGIFRRAMRMEGTSWPVRWVMWAAVRWASIFTGYRGAMRWKDWAALIVASIPIVLFGAAIAFIVFVLVNCFTG